jgi:hypothetical protein
VSYALREKRQPQADAKNLAILTLLQKIGAYTTMLKLSFKVAAAVLALSLPVKGDPFITGLSNDTAQPFLQEHVPNAFALRLDTIGGKGKSKYDSSSNPLLMQVKEAAHYGGLVTPGLFNSQTRIYGYSHPEPALGGLPSATWPGPTIIARSYQKLYVKWENVGRSDTNEGWTLKESHTYEKRPTEMQQASHKQATNKNLSHFYQLI